MCAASGALLGCAASATAPDGEHILDLRSGRRIDRAELIDAMRTSELVLLGERHDNPRHHALRGELIAALGADVAVVAEHLPRGERVRFGADLQVSLRAAGFDAQAWQWPLHRPLFAAVARSGAPLVGGNLPHDEVRRIAREGRAAWPADIARLLAQAPLGAQAQAALDADLVAGHCGHLGAQRLPGMRAAQRARDAAMFLALRDQRASHAILVAGNGHVRLDYGVGQLARALQPQARLVSVGFLESGEAIDAAPQAYTHAWVTAPAERADPCAGFRMPAPK